MLLKGKSFRLVSLASESICPFLLTSLAIAILWHYKKYGAKVGNSRLVSALKHKSFHLDIFLFISSGTIKIFLYSCVFAIGSLLAVQLQSILEYAIPSFKNSLQISTLPVLTFSLVCFLIRDYLNFKIHFLMHKIPLL